MGFMSGVAVRAGRTGALWVEGGPGWGVVADRAGLGSAAPSAYLRALGGCRPGSRCSFSLALQETPTRPLPSAPPLLPGPDRRGSAVPGLESLLDRRRCASRLQVALCTGGSISRCGPDLLVAKIQ